MFSYTVSTSPESRLCFFFFFFFFDIDTLLCTHYYTCRNLLWWRLVFLFALERIIAPPLRVCFCFSFFFFFFFMSRYCSTLALCFRMNTHPDITQIRVTVNQYNGKVITFFLGRIWHFATAPNQKRRVWSSCLLCFAFWLSFDFFSFNTCFPLRSVPFCLLLLLLLHFRVVWCDVVYVSLYGFHFLLLLLLCCSIFMVCFPMVHCGVAVVSMYGLPRLPLSSAQPPSRPRNLLIPSHRHTHARAQTHQ